MVASARLGLRRAMADLIGDRPIDATEVFRHQPTQSLDANGQGDAHVALAFADYLIPTMLDVPEVVATCIEQPEPTAPYGAKGIGELPTVSSTAAVVAAIRDATGLRLYRAPVRPDDIALTTPPGGARHAPP